MTYVYLYVYFLTLLPTSIFFYPYFQERNFNEKTGGTEDLLSFSCSLIVIDTHKTYNSKVNKIFGKYMNISKFKLFTLILYFYCAYN
jgi:hypothetical protein